MSILSDFYWKKPFLESILEQHQNQTPGSSGNKILKMEVIALNEIGLTRAGDQILLPAGNYLMDLQVCVRFGGDCRVSVVMDDSGNWLPPEQILNPITVDDGIVTPLTTNINSANENRETVIRSFHSFIAPISETYECRFRGTSSTMRVVSNASAPMPARLRILKYE